MVNGNLPPGWVWTTVDEIYEVVGGGTPSTAVEEYWSGNIPWITSADIHDLKDIRPRKQITQDAIRNSATTLVPAGTIIVVTRVSLGKVGLTTFPLCFSQDSQALLPKKNCISPDYLLYYLSLATKSFKQQSRGTTISGVTKKQLKDLPIPLPPLPEQERIVERIESLFTQLDAGVAALKRARAALKRYKASVLKAACEGRLADGSELEEGQLPKGWAWTTINELKEHLTSGSRGWAKYYADSGSLFIRVGNFDRLSKTINLDKIVLVNAPPGAEADRTRLRLKDLLITMTADVGMVGIVDERAMQWENAYINQHVGLVRLRNTNYVDFVAYALASDIGQKQFREKQYGATKLGLNFEDINSLRVPLPPLDEQQKIISEVEWRMSVVQELEGTIEANLRRAGRLRQAVLKRAFEGRLV